MRLVDLTAHSFVVEIQSKSNATATKTPFLAEIFPRRRLVEFTVALTNIPEALEAVAVSDRVSS